MESRLIIVDVNDSGKRLDLYLSNKFPELSRSRAQKLIKDKMVKVNREIKEKKYIVRYDDIIELTIPEPEPIEAVPQPIPLDIIYEDKYLLVINKPAGMVVHPAAGHQKDTLVNALLAHCPDLKGINDKIRPGIVHRLDKDTSGLLVVAKEQGAMEAIADGIKKRKVKRIYLALTEGRMKKSKGIIRLFLGRHPKDRKKIAVIRDEERGKKAVTHYQVISDVPGFSLVKLSLETGRTHQIRVSLAHLGYPVVNDPLYGRQDKALKGKGQLLHAYKLEFSHPYSKEVMSFTAPLPAYFYQKLEKIKCLPFCLKKGEKDIGF